MNTVISSIGEFHTTPLQKPKKPLGPLKNIRPLTLSNTTRKLLSVITLKRIQTKIDSYTGASQSGYKRGRSCGDIVWSQRMLNSVLMRKKWEYYKMGLDMSSAFDTINRQTILNVLGDAGCTEDELRLVRLLLSETKLKININGTISVEFVSTVGAFQGDALSGNLFTITLAAALHHLRAILSRVASTPYAVRTAIPNPPISNCLMPLESEYADDIDFINEQLEPLENILPIATEVFDEWNLYINQDKTDFVHVYLAAPKPNKKKVVPGTIYRGHEEWRKSITLGSMLCSVDDMKNRCILGDLAFKKFEKIWLKKSQICLDRKLKIYEAQVVSVILYNCNSWSAPQQCFDKLDATHRRHLRAILNIQWPTGIIKNKDLYKRCNTIPLSCRVTTSRWKMLGHILRGDENSPAYLSLVFAITGTSDFAGRLGRPSLNLLDMIRKDLKSKNINNMLTNIEDFNKLKILAFDKVNWRKYANSSDVSL